MTKAVYFDRTQGVATLLFATIITATSQHKSRGSNKSTMKKNSCKGRKCLVDFSQVDVNADAIDVPLSLDGSTLKTFTSTRKSSRQGHWYGEAGYSHANLLNKGVGPSGVDLWFGSMYDAEHDLYFLISPDSNGTSIVSNATHGSEFSPEGLPMEFPRNLTNAKSSMLANDANIVSDSSGIRKLVEDGSVIDVMYVWTKKAECRASYLNAGCNLTPQTEINIRGILDAIVAQINEAYANSGIWTSLRLVYAYRHPDYVEGAVSTELSAITNATDGIMDDVHVYRELYRADIVQLIASNSGICGSGWSGTPNFGSMFSVAHIDCVSGLTPLHEMGHSMGCHHDRAQYGDCGATKSAYAFGYRNPNAGFRDIMSYDCSLCDSSSLQCAYNCGSNRCPRVARYSNTYSLYNGLPIGNENNNCARMINEQRQNIASFYNGLPIAGVAPAQTVTAHINPMAPAPTPTMPSMAKPMTLLSPNIPKPTAPIAPFIAKPMTPTTPTVPKQTPIAPRQPAPTREAPLQTPAALIQPMAPAPTPTAPSITKPMTLVTLSIPKPTAPMAPIIAKPMMPTTPTAPKQMPTAPTRPAPTREVPIQTPTALIQSMAPAPTPTALSMAKPMALLSPSIPKPTAPIAPFIAKPMTPTTPTAPKQTPKFPRQPARTRKAPIQTPTALIQPMAPAPTPTAPSITKPMTLMTLSIPKPTAPMAPIIAKPMTPTTPTAPKQMPIAPRLPAPTRKVPIQTPTALIQPALAPKPTTPAKTPTALSISKPKPTFL